MTKLDHWKQANPIDQFAVILMSMEGHMDNFKHGIGSGKPLQALDAHITELMALLPFMRQGCWEQS